MILEILCGYCVVSYIFVGICAYKAVRYKEKIVIPITYQEGKIIVWACILAPLHTPYLLAQVIFTK